jgi:hypothetical protein
MTQFHQYIHSLANNIKQWIPPPTDKKEVFLSPSKAYVSPSKTEASEAPALSLSPSKPLSLECPEVLVVGAGGIG